MEEANRGTPMIATDDPILAKYRSDIEAPI
jgi:hypothetical protein